jgi:serine/threonine protein kinase
MSPEQAVGLTDEVDERSDIFSLGAVAYFMLAGRRPFPAASVPAILRKICDEEPPRLAEVRSDLGPHAAQLAAVVEIAMAKRPQERYPTAAELADDLARAARGALPAEVLRRAAALHRGRPATGSVGDRDVDATHATLPASA